MATDIDRLLSAVQHHAGRALGARLDDAHGALDASTHAGAAVELAAEAVLVAHDPRLVEKGFGAYHHLLDVVLSRVGRSPTGAVPKRSTQTIDATLAVALAARTDPAIGASARAALGVLNARNAAVHCAEPPGERALADLTAAMIEFVNAAVTAAGRTAAWLWGAEAHAATRRVEKRVAEVRTLGQQKLGSARAAYEGMRRDLPTDAWIRVRRELLSRNVRSRDLSDFVDCPACKEEVAVVTWTAEVDFDWSDGESVHAERPPLRLAGALSRSRQGAALRSSTFISWCHENPIP